MRFIDERQLSVREMREDEAPVVLEMLKDGFKDTENRLILYILTRPTTLLLMAVASSGLRFFLNSFSVALVIPVLLTIVGLKLLLWRYPDLKQIYSYYSIGQRKIWVAVYNQDDICGCVALDTTQDPQTVELKRMSVSRWYRRSGVGTHLLKFFEDHAKKKGFRCIVLYTSMVAKAATGLFNNCGYKVNGGSNWLCYTIVQECRKDI